MDALLGEFKSYHRFGPPLAWPGAEAKLCTAELVCHPRMWWCKVNWRQTATSGLSSIICIDFLRSAGLMRERMHCLDLSYLDNPRDYRVVIVANATDNGSDALPGSGSHFSVPSAQQNSYEHVAPNCVLTKLSTRQHCIT